MQQVNNRKGRTKEDTEPKKPTNYQDLQNISSQVSNPNEFIFHCEHCPANDSGSFSFKSIKGLHIHIAKSHPMLKEGDHDNEIEQVLENLSILKSRVLNLKRIPKSAWAIYYCSDMQFVRFLHCVICLFL